MGTAAKVHVHPARTRYYRLLEVGRKALGMDEDAFRALLRAHGARDVDGRPSRKTLSLEQLRHAVEQMRAAGFEPSREGDLPADWRAPRVAKIRAMWAALAVAGVVRDPGEAAMLRWCAGVTGCARIEWASSAQINRAVEGLKSWARRERVALDE